jgi:hypothetical protein
LTKPESGIILFGCCCAGEFGPADVKEKTPGVLSSGKGWHAMITFIGRQYKPKYGHENQTPAPDLKHKGESEHAKN